MYCAHSFSWQFSQNLWIVCIVLFNILHLDHSPPPHTRLHVNDETVCDLWPRSRCKGVRYHLTTKNAQIALTKTSFASFLQLHSISSKNYLDLGPASSKWLHVVEPSNTARKKNYSVVLFICLQFIWYKDKAPQSKTEGVFSFNSSVLPD